MNRRDIKDCVNKIAKGNALTILKQIPSRKIQMCVTSPPYYTLRNYGTKPQIWGGEKDCSHKWATSFTPPIGGQNKKDRPSNVGSNKIMNIMDLRKVGVYSNFCSICGAWKGELGLEPSPELYVKHLVMIFRQVKRVLRNDGILFLNIGDTYCGGGRAGSNKMYMKKHKSFGKVQHQSTYTPPFPVPEGMKAKDLMGIPWMLAFALRNDGWYLRQDIIWNKLNSMPESVGDRCVKSHEYLFLLSKSSKYYFDHKAIMEEAAYDGRKDTINKGSEKYPNGFDPVTQKQVKKKQHERWPSVNDDGVRMRNKRSVWTIPTKPSTEHHYASYPVKLIEPCILAGSSNKKPRHIVLDPFGGSGTTARLAKKLGRKYISIELKQEYIDIQKKLIKKTVKNLF